MNTQKLMAVALCATACLSTVVNADDFGIESAAPAIITDPANPRPGMVFNAYFPDYYMGWGALAESISKLPSESAAITRVDHSESFKLEQGPNGKARIGRWEGFVRCKRAGRYTFVLSKDGGADYYDCGFSFAVNGKILIPKGSVTASCDADLKVGWNKIDLVSQYDRSNPLVLTFKPKGSTAEPRQIGPRDLFHDEAMGDDW